MNNQRDNQKNEIAIIGIAAKLPEAENVTEFWHNLLQGRGSVRELPASRRLLDPFYDESKEYATFGYLEKIELFDAAFFKTLPETAIALDPAHRLLLEMVNNAVEDAGYYADQLADEAIGVFLSDLTPEYYQYLSGEGLDVLAGNLPANLAGRIAYVNGFTGPALTIDTACSSGLVALHMAAESIRRGDCKLAIVGGSSLKIALPIQSSSELGITSPTGQCRSFAAEADGTVGGEGVIALLLKPLVDAITDRDHIYAVIKGSAVNQDGSRSNGLTAPSPLAQKEVIQAAWQDARIDPATISYIETHGSATRLGDPIEITGITDAFKDYSGPVSSYEKQFCPIGAVKTNIGHLGNLAGLAGVIKTVLALKYQQIPPSLHFAKPNPFIDFENSPVFVATEVLDWKPVNNLPRRAGVSSFGLSGTNCHVILEEAPEIETLQPGTYQLITLSGNSRKQLERRIDDLVLFLEKHAITPTDSKTWLADLSYTLNCGRKQYTEWRTMFVLRDTSELIHHLYTSELHEKSEKVEETIPVFLLPDYRSGYEAYYVDYLQGNLPGMHWIQECRQKMNLDEHPRASYFAFLYTLAMLWQELGVSAKSIIGLGVGEKVSAVLAGRMSLSQAMEEAVFGETKPLDLGKLQTFMQSQLKKGRNCFIHFTEDSVLKQELEHCNSDPSQVRCYVTYQLDQGATLLKTIGEFYIQGYQLNFEPLGRGFKTPLPTHPYEKKVYWFDVKSARQAFQQRFINELDSLVKEQSHLSPEVAVISEDSATQVDSVGNSAGDISITLSKNPDRLEIQQALTVIWKSRLGLTEIGLDDDFIELGGDSIRAMLLMTDITRYLGVNLDLAFLLQYGTIRALTEKVSQELKDRGQLQDSGFLTEIKPQTMIPNGNQLGKTEPIARADGISYYQLSPSQKNLWLVHQMDPEEIVYNEPMAMILQGPVSLRGLEVALQKVIDRQSSLRTFFTTWKGEPVQGVYENFSINLKEEVFAGQEVDETVLTELVNQETSKPFDLEKAPLFRVKLIRIGEERHLFSFVVHHIILDGWSILILMRELCKHYDAFVHNLPDPFPALQIHYHDFAHWQNQQIASGQLREAESYWLDKLSGELPVLNLPTDAPRPAEKSFDGSSYSFHLPADLTMEIKEMSRSLGSTLFTTMLTFFEILLAKYTRQTELVIGTPSANRPDERLWDLIGFFVNTFVIRQKIDEEDSFVSLLDKVKTTLLESYRHKEYPFTELVSKLKVQRDPGRSAIFDVMYVFHNVGSIESESEKLSGSYGGVSFEQFSRQEIVSDYDLKLEFAEEVEHFYGKIEYSTRLFKPETIEQMARHMTHLIRQILVNPNNQISQVSLMTKDEWNWLMEVNQTVTDYASEMTILQLFNQQVRANPEAVALNWEDQTISYAELDARSNQLARVLREMGVKPNQIVGIMLERSIELIYGIYGIIKAGGAYLPLDPKLPLERIHYQLQDSGTAILLVHDQTTGILDQYLDSPNDILEINLTDESMWLKSSRETVEQWHQPTDLAYVIYTSGSTGRPKGVMIEHHSLVNRLQWQQREYAITVGDVLLQKTTCTFDISVFELFLWGISGASLSILPPLGEKDPAVIIETIEQHKVTLIHFVPTMLGAFLAYLASQTEEVCRLASLRHVFCSGESLFWSQVRDFAQILEEPLGVELHNLYGPTEATIDVSYYHCTTKIGEGVVPIGKPIANIQLFVLDEHLKPLPVGIPGQIGITGVGLARGYLNRPELDDERFVRSDLLNNQRIYLTGDLGRFTSDGNIDFLGRLDQQIKLRGYRIELGEIEAVLLDHPLVQAGLVLLSDDNLIAYVVSGPGLTKEDLRDYLGKLLPEYMIPVFFVFLAELPILPNGKVDRSSLSRLKATPETEVSYQAPRNEGEKKLAQIWSKILGVEKVSVYDNFFELGGDSIKAIQIAAELNKLGIAIRMNEIIHQPTIDSLYLHLMKNNSFGSARLHPEASQPRTNDSHSTLIEGEVPLTPIQQWFFEQDFKCPEHYNHSMLIQLGQEINPVTLEKAFNLLIMYHDTLRLVYHDKTGTMFYHNHSIRKIKSLIQLDLSELTQDEQKHRLAQIGEEIKGSFDLERGLLINGALIKLSENSSALLITIHHLVTDGVSWRILLEDLEEIYQALAEGAEPILPDKTTSYKEWANWLYQYSQSSELLAEVPYWRTHLESASSIPLDLSMEKIKNSSEENLSARQFSGQLTIEETELLLTQVNQGYNTSVLDILVTALIRTLCQWNHQENQLIMLESHGRQELSPALNLSRTVGWFTALYPISLNMKEKSDISEQIKLVKEQLRQVPNGGIGYGILKYLTNQLDTEMATNIPIVFNYLGEFTQMNTGSFSLISADTGPDISPQNHPSYELEVNGIVRDGQFSVWFICSNLHCSKETIQNLVDSYLDHLREIIQHCMTGGMGYTPSDFDLVDLEQDELDQLSEELGSLLEGLE